MLPAATAPLTETSDIDPGLTIRIGFGGGVYVEVDTEGVGCAAALLGFTAGGVEAGGPGLLPGVEVGFPVVTTVGKAAGEGADERVASRFTFGLPECPEPAVWLGPAPLTGFDAPTTPVGLPSPETVSWPEDGGPPERVITSTTTMTMTPATAAAAAAALGTRRRLATVTGLGNPS